MNRKDDVILQTELDALRLVQRGKVRDIYECGDFLLMVVTDRLSAFDVVLPDGIPQKGEVLTSLSVFWFSMTKDLVDNHLVSVNIDEFPHFCPTLGSVCSRYGSMLRGRSMLVKKARPMPLECIVRGYLSGSGWNEYKANGTICSIPLPPGLQESDRLPEPIFTPSTKAGSGHDVNISFDEAVALTGAETAGKLRLISLEIYEKAASYAEGKGIIIADTKFEFGIYEDKLILIDEVLTPDSSRFWSLKDYCPGRAQDSFDKQIVRDYLSTLEWGKTYPGPTLPREIIEKTSRRYRDILNILTG
ncbi:MAG: phosphoribosylaminoimidazolesuccinocarboxamide synthase [Nitrospirae bacterium]|nr:phosphoribosylaminoimidazolesuccinocarboxamide synthase [Nitrospirota bacterium]